MWTSLPRAGFDTETTGINVLEDRIVTAAIIIDDDGERTHYTWLADPGIEIPAGAAKIHGVTTEIARRDGQPAAQVVAEIADVLEGHLAAGNPAIAFNAPYDFTLLESELRRYGLPTLAQRLGGRVYPVIDPYFLDRHVDRYRRGKRTLAHLAAHYRVPADETFHNAEGDVVMTMRVLDAIVQKYPELADSPLDVLDNDQRRAYTEFTDFISRRYCRAADEPRGWPVSTAQGV